MIDPAVALPPSGGGREISAALEPVVPGQRVPGPTSNATNALVPPLAVER